mgnify:CR=1 FL=1
MKTLSTFFTLLLLVGSSPLFAQTVLSSKVLNHLPNEAVQKILDLELTVNPPEDFRLIATYVKAWNSGLQAWESSDSTEHYYDENGDRIELLNRVYDNGLWPIDRHSLYTYNDDHQITSTISENWDGANWIHEEGNSRTFRTYNDNGDLTFYHFQQWKNGDWADYIKIFLEYDPITNYLVNEVSQFAVSGTLVNLDRYRYLEYDTQGNALVVQQDVWDNAQWVLVRQEINEYNASNNKTFQLVQIPDGANWIDHSRTFQYFQGGTRRDSTRTEDWDVVLQNWLPNSKSTYTYNSNGDQTLSIDWEWGSGSGSWVYDAQQITEYDVDFNKSSVVVQSWDLNAMQWEDVYRDSYTYDENGNLQTELNQTWNDVEGSWQNGTHTTYYYETFVGTKAIKQLPASAATLFPNPSNGKIQIRLNEQLFTASETEIQVYNLLAQPLARLKANVTNAPIDLHLAFLPQGTYFLELRQADKRLMKKIVISR